MQEAVLLRDIFREKLPRVSIGIPQASRSCDLSTSRQPIKAIISDVSTAVSSDHLQRSYLQSPIGLSLDAGELSLPARIRRHLQETIGQVIELLEQDLDLRLLDKYLDVVRDRPRNDIAEAFVVVGGS
jgi:hypothetical protein